MADARELQYGIDFETGDAVDSIDELNQAIESMEELIGSAEAGVQLFGAEAVSACNDGRQGVRVFSVSLDMAGESIANAGDAADEFGQQAVDAAEGARQFGAGTSSAGDIAENFSSGVKTAAGTARQFGRDAEAAGEAVDKFGADIGGAGANTRQFGADLHDAGNEAESFRNQVRQTAEGAASMGAAFRETMADGLEAGQSLTQSFRTGLVGALDFSRKKVKTFATETISGAKNIGTAFAHPVKTIKTALVSALRDAQDGIRDTGDAANNTENDLEDMGAAGENAGNRVSEAIKSAVAAFVGFEVIKTATDQLKNFASAALNAFGASETTSAQFSALFTSGASEWVDNFSDAVHRSTSEVQSFMVSNDTMYRKLGLTADASEELSKVTTSLAYDLGNAFKMDDAEALSVLQRYIEGDTSALFAYGIAVDEVALKQSALQLGLSSNIDSLDDASAAQVRLNAVLAQSGAIQKAAVEQTGGLTNATKNLKGVVADFLVSAGSKLAPAVEGIINSVLDTWPTLEPMLLSFASTLGDGLGAVAPSLIRLGQNLIPSLAKTLGTLLSATSPVLQTASSLAGTVLLPLANIISQMAESFLPPLVDIFEVLNRDAIQPLMPVVEETAAQLLPALGLALSAASSAVGPLVSAFSPLLTSVLPVAAVLISELAGAAIPPLTQILGVATEALRPIVSIAAEFVQALLPAAGPLISAVGTGLSGVVLPALEALSPILSFAAGVLGTIAGWVSDLIGFFANGAGKVASFFGGIFGGAKESSEAVDGLTGSVNGLENAASSETSLAVDTSEYSSNISTASKAAEKAVTEATNAAREISNENYGLMANDAETAYARMTLDAESAWDRMAAAADNGAALIVKSFGKIASAAQSVNSANISVSGVSIPGNAEGTDNWRGGWTRMNEEGGELAYLPSGTAIIPADKTDEIINNSTATEASFTDSSTFAPQIKITLGGGEDVDIDGLDSHILELLERWYREKKEDEYHNRAMQGAYARN